MKYSIKTPTKRPVHLVRSITIREGYLFFNRVHTKGMRRSTHKEYKPGFLSQLRFQAVMNGLQESDNPAKVRVYSNLFGTVSFVIHGEIATPDFEEIN